MNLGDRNTHFYHMYTITKRKAHKIEYLKLDDDTFCLDPDRIKAYAWDYFINLFGLSPVIFVHYLNRPLPHAMLQPSVVEFLTCPIQFWETTAVLKSTKPFKALGPDGYQPFFFQKYWHIIGLAVHALVQKGVFYG